MEVGKIYKTRGGWSAIIIWVTLQGFWAAHKPGTPEERVPVYHWKDGSAHSVLAIYEPPSYGEPSPADIILEEEKQ